MSDQPKRSFPLPPLPPRPGLVGDLARRLLVDGDLTAVLPLRDALLDEGRTADATAVTAAFGRVAVDHEIWDEYFYAWDAQRLWRKFYTEVAAVLVFDLYDASAAVFAVDRRLAEAPESGPDDHAEIEDREQPADSIDALLDRWMHSDREETYSRPMQATPRRR